MIRECTICYNVHQIVVMLDGCRDWYTMPDGIVFIIDRLFSAACAPVRMGILFDFWCPVGVVIQNIL